MKLPMTTLARGMHVRVRHVDDTEWTNGRVLLVSPVNKHNRQSVGVVIEGPVRVGDGFILNALPLNIDYDAETITGLTGDLYELDYDAA